MSDGPPSIAGGAVTEPERPIDDAPREARPQRARAIRVAPWLLALAAYIVVAVVLTWPVGADPAGTVAGAPGDATGNITLIRYRNELGVGPLSNAVTTDENAPFGISLPGATSLPQIAIEGPMQVVAAITGSEILAFNLAVLAGLILTALACFLLCLHITGNPWAAGIAGLAYGFNPWIMERAGGHVHFTHLWALALVVLGLLMIREGRGRRAWLLYGAAAVVGVYINTYFTLFIGVILAAFIAADLGAALLAKTVGGVRAVVRRGAGAAAIVVVALIPQAIVSIRQSGAIDELLVGTRSPEDRLYYGARWWEYVVPSHSHPVFDEWSAPFRFARLHLSNPSETNLYLGLSVLALAAVGIGAAIAARRAGRPGIWTAWFAALLVLFAFITSLPSRVDVLGVGIPMPAAGIAHVVEPWRVYARLVAVVALGVAILAAIGMAFLLERIPRRAWPIAALAVAGIVAFDLAGRHATFDADTPPIYRMLADQPGDDIRVEYPLVPPTSGRHLAYIFFTEAAHRPLFNGARPGTVEASIQANLSNPALPWVPGALASLGVKWAVLHADAFGGPVPVPAAGFRLVGRSTTDSLYRIVAPPAPAVAAPAASFWAPEPGPDGRSLQWMLTRRGTISILNPGAETRALRLRFTIASFNRPRAFAVAQAGRVLTRGTAATSARWITVTVSARPGVTNLAVTTPTPPDSIAEVLGLPDARHVSLQLSSISVARAGGGA